MLCIFIFVPAFFANPIDSADIPRPSASRAENIGGSPNSLGVYPTRISWQRPADNAFKAYHVYRSGRADSGFERITREPVTNASGGSFTFIDNNPSAAPGQPFFYRIHPLNSTGETLQFSETVLGYGALSHETYMIEYNKTIRSSHQKLTLMHKSGSIAKLGSDDAAGSISGTLAYRARIAGLGARVTMRYNRYADFFMDNNASLGPCFILTGDVNTSANMSQNGTMDGTVTASGMYPGRIYYDNIVIKNGAAAGGSYGVEPQGFSRMELDWRIIER